MKLTMIRCILGFLGVFFLCANVAVSQEFDVLIFSKTAGFRHASIEDGQQAIQKLGDENNFTVDLSENSEDFNTENLSKYECVVFLSTTGDILNSEQQAAFEQYISQGGGYVGIHAASDTEYGWDWYGGLVGAYFDSHPAIQDATVEVADRVHPSTSFLGDYWERRDEWYNYRENPRGKVHVLATLDEATYNGANMGHDHPIAWCHEYEGGRSWYTGGGHTSESYSEENFMNHVLGGIQYASGSIAGDFTATVSEKFELQVLDNDPLSPMALAVLPSLDVLYIERAGKLKVWDAESGGISLAGELSVDASREDGLIGITIDPEYESNNWIYLFYSPSGLSQQNVSRFSYVDGQLDLSSEVIMLEIPVQRDECCHSGGDLEFDSDGNLWIATGDNVNPFQSGGYAPIDERPGRAPFDAQGTSGNTNDLRGKVLRIRPLADGTYEIPEGNLFSSEADGLAEIYVMGVRNAFRIAVNDTGELVWGDVGPDASGDNGNRGPRGYDEINRTSVPGNFGWPYAVADNKMYRDFNFSNNSSGDLFDPENLINDSPNNTGTSDLPPALPAWIYYHSGSNPDRPEFNAPGGRSVLGGVFNKHNPDLGDTIGLPRYFDNVLLAGDWSRNWIKEIRVDEAGNLLQINPFIPHIDLNSPIDIEIGPDGNVYIAEWGTGFTSDNPDARIIKVEYRGLAANRAPVALISSDVKNGIAPLTVQFDGSDSRDPDIGDDISFEWDFDDDGMVDSAEESPSFIYEQNGVYNATLTLTDTKGERSVAQIEIVVGNSEPRISIDFPVDGGFFAIGDTVEYSVSTEDAEDGDECAENLPLGISVEPSIGHDDHSHGEGEESGCTGEFITSPHGDESDDVFYVLNAAYSDRGGEVEFPLADKTFHVLQPKFKQAQHAAEYFDIRTEVTGDFLGGGLNMAFINHDSYLRYSPMNFKNIEFMTVRWAALNKVSRIEVHIDSPDGPIIAEREVPITGAWQTYDYFTMELEDPGGTHDVYLVFKNPGQGGLGNINFMEFHGQGISTSDSQAGMGLTATYYENSDFSGASVTRVEPMIAWNWEDEQPVEGIPSDEFSVKWEGRVVAPTTETYDINATTEGGSYEVIVDGIDVTNASFSFVAGEEYDIEVRYVHTSGEAAMALRWKGPNPVNVIHTQYLRTKANSSSVDEWTAGDPKHVFPNPFSDIINVTSDLIGKNFRMYNAVGVLVRNGILEESVEVKGLPGGFYTLAVEGKKWSLVKVER